MHNMESEQEKEIAVVEEQQQQQQQQQQHRLGTPSVAEPIFSTQTTTEAATTITMLADSDDDDDPLNSEVLNRQRVRFLSWVSEAANDDDADTHFEQPETESVAESESVPETEECEGIERESRHKNGEANETAETGAAEETGADSAPAPTPPWTRRDPTTAGDPVANGCPPAENLLDAGRAVTIFAQLIIGSTQAVGVSWTNDPNKIGRVPVSDRTDDEDQKSFVTAMDQTRSEQHVKTTAKKTGDRRSVESFVTAASRVKSMPTKAIPTANNVSSETWSATTQMYTFFTVPWKKFFASKNAAIDAAAVDIATMLEATDDVKGRIRWWISTGGQRSSPMASSLAREVLDEVDDNDVAENDGQELEPKKKRDRTPKSPTTINERVCIETILTSETEVDMAAVGMDSSVDSSDDVLADNVEVVVYQYDSSASVATSSKNGYFCCMFGTSSKYPTSFLDQTLLPQKKIDDVASLGSTEVSSTRCNGTEGQDIPWYRMPTLDATGDMEGDDVRYSDRHTYCGASNKDGHGGEQRVSRLAILHELYRFQNGFCSDRVMEMVHFPTTQLYHNHGELVVLDSVR